jgi:hypothetical protein
MSLTKVAHLYETGKDGVNRLPIFVDDDGSCWTWDDPEAGKGALCECAPWQIDPVKDIFALGADAPRIDNPLEGLI